MDLVSDEAMRALKIPVSALSENVQCCILLCRRCK